MNDRAEVRPITVSIAAVERDTGLSKDTLRVWERRYAFPMPVRDSYGERAYPLDQVEKLRVIKRLLDSGHRPGRVVSLDIEALQKISDSLAVTPQKINTSGQPNLREYLLLIKEHDVMGLRRLLSQSLVRMGMGNFLCDVVAPLNTSVGDAWMRGQFEVFEEHIYTESITMVLRGAMANSLGGSPLDQPRILLSTFPQEPHGLGILMAQAMLEIHGAQCISLGTQTPIWDIVLAATSYKVDIVALSFTASQNPNYVVNGLEELRSKLAPDIEIWVGGANPIIQRKSIEGVQPVVALQDIAAQLTRWHSTH